MSERSPADAQVRRLSSALGSAVRLESVGGQSRTFRIDGTDDIVTVRLSWPDEVEPGCELTRRVTLQERIARRVSVPVPRVVRVLRDLGLVVVRRLDGQRLLDVDPPRRAAVRREVATTVGTLLGELHTWDPAAYEDVAQADGFSPEDWREETAELAGNLEVRLDAGNARTYAASSPNRPRRPPRGPRSATTTWGSSTSWSPERTRSASPG